MKLSKAQIEMLELHVGTTRAKPRRNPVNGTYFREIHFPTNPTAMALRARGLLDWRGYDGKTFGGWFLTAAGTTALVERPIATGPLSES